MPRALGSGAVLSTLVATARVIADALVPIVPGLAAGAQHQLTAEPTLPPPHPLIERIELEGASS